MRLFERNIFVIENLALSFLILELYWFSWESLWGLFDYIHGPSSLFIWRLVDVSWFSSIDKDASFREKHFCHWEFGSIFQTFMSYIDSREKAFGDFLIMIHGPSSLFIWQLVDVSWFSSIDERCIFSRGTFLSLRIWLYLSTFQSYIDSCEKAFGDFLIMIHGPSSLFIWRLVDVSWFLSIDERCIFSRGTFLSLRIWLYLSTF